MSSPQETGYHSDTLYMDPDTLPSAQLFSSCPTADARHAVRPVTDENKVVLRAAHGRLVRRGTRQDRREPRHSYGWPDPRSLLVKVNCMISIMYYYSLAQLFYMPACPSPTIYPNFYSLVALL